MTKAKTSKELIDAIFLATNDAGEIESALHGLSQFVFHSIEGGSATSADLGALRGLVAAISALAQDHLSNLDKIYSDLD
ncbi:hypothetical protein JZO70_10205 [Enterococcus sp. 669A]|uniref:Uncharacterized protein n=1 Tax=Candidatus Enterococcus moelleringii TaxID=2815325 RepID=A0ABS3LA90_9ENTE|nr:hypothetical protein [Enterococcus sp. 669A]MBO1306536.1 hypothetical protein [Enterococcus sp. 669A]